MDFGVFWGDYYGGGYFVVGVQVQELDAGGAAAGVADGLGVDADDFAEMMLISQFGKIIRIDTKTIRAAGRATQGVRLLNLEPEDKVAAAVIIPPEELKDDEPTLLQ